MDPRGHVKISGRACHEGQLEELVTDAMASLEGLMFAWCRQGYRGLKGQWHVGGQRGSKIEEPTSLPTGSR